MHQVSFANSVQGAANCSASAIGIFVPMFPGDAEATPEQVVKEARTLGVNVIRTRIDTGDEPGPKFAVFEDAGMTLALTVRHRSATGGSQPTVPPITEAEMANYREVLADHLDRLHPELLMVENEELADKFFAGTPEQYLGELQSAAQVAHARGIPLTNGGITTRPLQLLVWED
jgi:hypothetical protein